MKIQNKEKTFDVCLFPVIFVDSIKIVRFWISWTTIELNCGGIVVTPKHLRKN